MKNNLSFNDYTMSRASNQRNNLIQWKNLATVPQSMRQSYKKPLLNAIEGQKWPKQVISDESVFSQDLTSINDAPYLTMNLRDIPHHIHFPLDREQKNRFYPDWYAVHYFSIIEYFALKDKTEWKLLGQLFFHKQDVEWPYYYYIFESYVDEKDPKSLYEGKAFHLITPDQREKIKSHKIR